MNLIGQPIDNDPAFLIGDGNIGILWRHFAVGHYIHDIEPPKLIASFNQVGIERVDAELPLLFVGAVARVAGLFQNGLDLRMEGLHVWLWRFSGYRFYCLIQIAGTLLSLKSRLFESRPYRLSRGYEAVQE